LEIDQLINQEQAQALCVEVVDSLGAWPSLHAALQSGGLEVKASGIVSAAATTLGRVTNKLVLREYEHIDIVLIVPESVGSASLDVDTVLEVKFNYARQTGEIDARLPYAVNQANRYRNIVGANCAYVLYFIAAPHSDEIPIGPRDSGWGYWNGTMAPAVDHVRESAIGANSLLLAEYAREAPVQLYCALIECPAAPVALKRLA
jgi:hypothetical protein